MTASEHGAVRDLIPLYALGALAGSEDGEQVCAHLATGCLECAEELAAYARVGGKLGASLPEVAPRPEVRAKLASRLEKEAQSTTSVVATGKGKVVPFPATRPRASRSGWVVAALAAGLAAVGFYLAYQSRGAVELAENERDAAVDRATKAERANDALRALLETDNKAMKALASGEARVVDLSAQKGQTGGAAVVWVGDKWIFVGQGFKPHEAGKHYHLWFGLAKRKDEKKPVEMLSAGALPEPGPDGIMHAEFAVPSVPPEMVIGAGGVSLEKEPNPTKPSPEVTHLGIF